MSRRPDGRGLEGDRAMSGFAAVVELSGLDGTNGFQIDSDTSFEGDNVVASAGDLNGDGIDDFVIGAQFLSPNALFSGAAYVVFGTASGFPANFQLSSLNGANGFKLEGAQFHDYAGSWVASAGDLNHDGVDDLLVGARGVHPTGEAAGAVYVVYGKNTAVAGNFAAVMQLGGLDGTEGFRINGILQGQAGWSVSSAGDVNGDGFDDIVIGAAKQHIYGAYGPSPYNGAAYVVFGKSGGLGASFDLASLDGTNGFMMSGEGFEDRLGYRVASVGDFNNDGFDDLIVSAPNAPHSTYAGKVYVVFGHGGGFAANLDPATLNGTNGFVIDGEGMFNSVGVAIASAGDVNGDGYDDIIVGVIRRLALAGI